jgi:hypothetical protein
MSLVLQSSGGGSVTLEEPVTASNFTITVPAVTGTMATLTTPSFVSTIGVGGATPAASGAGITFPATQSASSDANTLDDYEEGTFTPTWQSGITSPVYDTRDGTYTKIGKFVYYRIRLAVTGGTPVAGHAVISGLPFTPSVSSGAYFSYVNGTVNNTTLPTLYIPASTAQIELYGLNGNPFLGTNFIAMASSNLWIVGSYMAAN